ncbi:FIG000875: Thioredoxin domain-containing protein EC-YbbN [hydrothermal vent metagenome]|uniref:FIG000875: Thioredoxin domain-containing protein EC-YbbN n=1 Tax=hydrothermal vent metagenome TaxID=652676 RepID=A0A3B0RFM6_9ZZZZ
MQDMDAPQGRETVALIKDGDMSTFMADVIEKSAAIPVLVSFYSSWSENCKQLTPIVEKIVQQAGGAVQMVRIDFEKNQQLAAQMKIQSVPTVVVFVDQRPVDAFAGVKSEAEVKEFIARFAPEMQPSPTEQMIEQAVMLFDGGDFQKAAELYSQILQIETENAPALAGLAQSLIRLNDLENAKAVLDGTPKQQENDPAITAARAALDMAEQLAELGDADALEQAIKEDADNHQARFDLALVLWASGDQDAAADHLLSIISRDRGWNEDGARKQLVKFFEIAGPMDPFTVKIRKKLSSILFA